MTKISHKKTRIGPDEDDVIVVELGDSTLMQVTVGYLTECVQIRAKHEQEIRDLESAVNAREPAKFLPIVIKELDSRGNEAGKLRSEGEAGKIMWGQAQAYRDSAALIRSYLPSTAKGAFTE